MTAGTPQYNHLSEYHFLHQTSDELELFEFEFQQRRRNRLYDVGLAKQAGWSNKCLTDLAEELKRESLEDLESKARRRCRPVLAGTLQSHTMQDIHALSICMKC